MATDFVLQSTSRYSDPTSLTAVRLEKPPPWAARQWVAYFQRNAATLRPIPWERGAEATADELAAIGRSLQAWQLGETSEGNHLRAAAKRYAERVGDPDYPPAVDLFIREEQRHGETLETDNRPSRLTPGQRPPDRENARALPHAAAPRE